MNAPVATELDIASLTRSVHEAVAGQAFGTHTADAAFDAALFHCVETNVHSIVDIAAGRLTVAEADPAHALCFAEVVADLGIPFGALERAYWVGVERLLQEWIACSRAGSAQGKGSFDELIGDPTSAVFPYVLRMLDLVRNRHDEVSTVLCGSGEDRRREVVEQLLRGAVSRHDQELDNTLGYRLRGWHLGLVFETRDRADTRRTLARLCDRAGSWGSLVVPDGAGRASAWLGFARRPDAMTLHRLRQAIAQRGGPVAVGGPAEGIDGIRQAHDEAHRAAELRPTLAAPPGCVWYRDVRLEAFLLGDVDAAHHFVVAELGTLAEESERAHRIRETLLASLATGSHARAAAELGVHENTVRLRLRSAVDVLGDALHDRRTELLVALRLRRALGAPQPDSDVAEGAAG